MRGINRLHEEVNLEKIAEESFGFSGAQLESVMNEAAIYAMREEAIRLHSVIYRWRSIK